MLPTLIVTCPDSPPQLGTILTLPVPCISLLYCQHEDFQLPKKRRVRTSRCRCNVRCSKVQDKAVLHEKVISALTRGVMTWRSSGLLLSFWFLFLFFCSSCSIMALSFLPGLSPLAMASLVLASISLLGFHHFGSFDRIIYQHLLCVGLSTYTCVPFSVGFRPWKVANAMFEVVGLKPSV